MWTIHSKTVTVDRNAASVHRRCSRPPSYGPRGLKPEETGVNPEASNDTTGILIPGSESSPEKVWGSQDHILKVLQGQPPIMVTVCFIQHLLTDQGHLLGTQLPTGQPGHRLLQVPCTDVVVIVEVCEADSEGTSGGRRHVFPPCLELHVDTQNSCSGY